MIERFVFRYSRRLAAAICALTLWLSVHSDALAQRALDASDIPSPDPELERQSFEVADGFEVNLFAVDPQIANPIQMNFDADGRLWVVCSELYPHILPGQEAQDKVVVLEDVDGDGVAEKSSVFAEGLLIPTGIEPGDGGAYVGNSTELLFLKDTDGDGRADQRRVMLSGFGTEDTHHILHTLRWGYDGQLYFNQSIYIHSHIETPYGVRRLGGAGTWMFRPESMRLEVFTRGLCNPWGHHFDDWGQSFGTDGAGGEGINYLFPGTVMFTAPGAKRVVPGLNPGSPKHCGLEILSGRHLPDDWQGNLITNDFRAHRVCRFVLRENGSGYSSHEQPELIKTTHVAFRPVDVKMGPDGAIYIADWYNPIIQHGEVDFRDPRRDHTHGRIWRVTAKNRPLIERPQLTTATTSELLDQLKSPNAWTRHFAKRVLKERGKKDVLPELTAWIAALDAVDASGDSKVESQHLEALWMLQALDEVQPTLLESLLAAKDPRVRAAAVRAASHLVERLPKVNDYLATAIADDHPRVRLEAVRALAQISSVQINNAKAATLALTVLTKPMDRFLDFALWQTCRDLESTWMPQLTQGSLDWADRPDQLLFALDAIDSSATVQPLLAALEQGKLNPSQQARALTLLARVGGAEELGRVFQRIATDGSVAVANRAVLLDAIIDAAAARKLQPTGDLSPLASMLTSRDDQLRAAAARAAGLWKVEPAREQLISLALDNEVIEGLKRAAITGLGNWGDDPCVAALVKLASAGNAPPIRRAALIALAGANIKQAAELAPAVLAADASGNPEQIAPVFAALLANKKGAGLLAASIKNHPLSVDVAKIGLRQARVTATVATELVEALQTAGGLSGKARELSPEEQTRLVAEVRNRGNTERGELVFRRADLACLKCHAIAGAGGNVGPDLASIGASAQVDYLLDSILAPNKQVKENYHSTVVATNDGRVLNGIIVQEDDVKLVLRSGEDGEIELEKSLIDDRSPGGSLMPVGLADELTETELVDLVRFMSALGKVGELAVGQDKCVRKWEVLDAKAEKNIKRLKRRGLEATILEATGTASGDLDWLPLYSTVAGDVPQGECQALQLLRGEAPVAIIRTTLTYDDPRTVRLRFNDVSALRVWLDGQPVSLAGQPVLDLAAGGHTLTCAIESGQRKKNVRLEIDELTDANAKVGAASGK